MNKLSDKAAEHTRKEWRELGFFYTKDDDTKEWRLTGSKNGLLRFVDLLRAYASDERNTLVSEHEHYGPHMYLEVMTWTEPGMDENSIFGTLVDLSRLADIIFNKLGSSMPGEAVRIREEYSSAATYTLLILVREDGFDPASIDPQLVG